MRRAPPTTRQVPPAALSRALLASVIALVACGGSTSALHPQDARSARSCGVDVTSCLPLGARDVVLLDLDAMRRAPELTSILDAIRPADVEAFERTWSFGPGAVHAIAYGSYEPGELIVLEGDFDAAAVVEHVGDRMNTVEIVDADPPRRVGFVGAERVDVAWAGAHRLAIGREHGAPMMRLLGRLRGRTVPAFVDRLSSNARARIGSAPLCIVSDMQGRFEIDTDAGLVLSRIEWAVLSLAPSRASASATGGTLDARWTLHGALPGGAETNLRGMVQAVADSEYGGVFGIRAALGTLDLRVTDQGAELSLRLEASRVASGIPLITGRPSFSEAGRETRK